MASYKRAFARHRPAFKRTLHWSTACALLLFSFNTFAQETAAPAPTGGSVQQQPQQQNPLTAIQQGANQASGAFNAGVANATQGITNATQGITNAGNAAVGGFLGNLGLGSGGSSGSGGGIMGALGLGSSSSGGGGVMGALGLGGGSSSSGGSGAGGAGPTATHVCQNTCPGASTSPSLSGAGCDTRYRCLELTYNSKDNAVEKQIARDAGKCSTDCDNMRLRSIEGSRPPKGEPLKHITTPLKSLIKDYSPYLYFNLKLQDLSSDESRMLRTLYRGTVGDSRSAFSMINVEKAAPPTDGITKGDDDSKQFAQCVDQIRTPSQPTSPEEWAKLVRLKLDNCSNQYILRAALYPAYKENVKKFSYDNPSNPAQKIGLYSHCQPLRIQTDAQNDYHANEYIIGAWKKMLSDPSFRINERAMGEPKLPQGVTLDNKIDPPTSVPDVRLSMIATTPYEEIIDPTHPFSPRWDFEYNERDKFSPMTAAYGGDPQNAVFCAGDKKDKIYKVDVLRFRDERIKFSEKVQQRIDYNANCKAGKGMQAKPCCLPYLDGPPNSPTSYKCRMLPCKVCFAFSADRPACSTSYTGGTDRKSIIPGLLPVRPEIRAIGQIAQLAQAAQNFQMPAGVNVQQMTSMLNSNMALLNTLAPNLPISSITGLLSGQMNLTANLQGMLNGQINLSNLGGLMNIQGNIMNALGNLNPAQLQGMLSGQLNFMGALGNFNINQISGFMQIPGNFLQNLPQNLNLSQITGALNLQGNIMGAFGNLNVQGALGQLGNIGGMLQGLPANMNLSQLSANIQAQIPGFGNMNINNLTVGDLQNAINSGMSGLQNFNPSQAMSQIGPAITNSIQSLTQLPGNLSVQNVSGFLNTAGAQFANLPGNLNISNVTSSLQSAFSSVGGTLNSLNAGGLGNAIGNMNIGANVNMPWGNVNLNTTVGGAAQQLGALFNGQANLLSGLPAGMNIASIQGMVNAQLGNIMSLGANFNVGQLSSFIGGQLGGLQGLNGLTSLASLGGMQGLANLGSLGSLSGIAGNLGNLGGTLGSLGSGLGSAIQGAGGIGSLMSGGGLGGLAGGVGGAAGAAQRLNPCSAGKDVIYLFCAGDVTRKAYCRPDELNGQNKETMASQCAKLRAPLTPLNKLKMRYHDPADVANSELPSGVPEGLQFNDYFKPAMDKHGHMPYMKLHDTGRSIQTSTSTDQDPLDSKGQFTAVVGVGREGIAGDEENKDQRCLLGGWGESTTVGGAPIMVPDPVTSWTELKLYQTRGARKDGVYCIGRYDKVFKPESTEERALNLLGGKINVVRSLTGNEDSKRATVISLPLSWRGYLMDEDEETRFPNFGEGDVSIQKGLNNVEPGDIVILPENGSAGSDKPGLPRVGVVTKLSRNKNCGEDCWVTVMIGDDGAAPDTCGMTDAMGQVVTRYFYKPGATNSLVEENFEMVNSDMSCEDQNLQRCVLSTWNDIEFYRPRDNRREISDISKLPAVPKEGKP